MFTFLPHLFSFKWCWLLWAGAAGSPVRRLEANVTVKIQWRSPLPTAPLSYIKRGGLADTVRWLQTLFFQISDVDNVSISCWELTLNLRATFRVTDLYISFLRVSFVKKEVVTAHSLVHLNSLGHPVFGGPWAYGGDEGLEKGDAQARVVLLDADSLRDGRA